MKTLIAAGDARPYRRSSKRRSPTPPSRKRSNASPAATCSASQRVRHRTGDRLEICLLHRPPEWTGGQPGEPGRTSRFACTAEFEQRPTAWRCPAWTAFSGLMCPRSVQNELGTARPGSQAALQHMGNRKRPAVAGERIPSLRSALSSRSRSDETARNPTRFIAASVSW